MRLIIAGGGTGGHIYPAITIARTVLAADAQAQILFVGTKEGLEADIIPKEGFPLETITVHGFARRLSWSNVRNIGQALAAIWTSRQIIQRFKPQVVIGTGGYVCGPVLLAASLMGIPTLIQEQNVIPGITNRILARFVTVVAVGYGEAARYFPRRVRLIETGNPIRPEVMRVTREEGRQNLGLQAGKTTIFVAGGSRGARSINTAMLDVYRQWQNRKDLQVLHVTGQNEYNNVVERLRQAGIDFSKNGNIMIKPYLYNMPDALAVADLAVSRAGAIALAELTARGVPAILIPYPYAAENHQEYNARILAQRGAAVVIRDAELTGATLLTALDKLLTTPGVLTEMAKASHALGKPQAAEKIARLVFSLAGK